MISIQRAYERGVANLSWLDTRHAFSFADYYDPAHMGFGPLNVINEDRVSPGKGFPTHSHRDMESISYVLEGALAHKDSFGTESVIRPGDVQVMSASKGVRHREFNHSKTEPVHFLQISVRRARTGIEPRYEQRTFPEYDKRGCLRIVGSSDGRDGSIVVHQDIEIFATILDTSEQVNHGLSPGRKAWVQIARGAAELNGKDCRQGDGAAVESEIALTLTTTADGSEILLFDLP